MLAHAGGRLIRVRHTRRLADNLDALREFLDAADREFAATAEQYRRLRNRGVNQNDLARYVRRTFGMEGGAIGGRRRTILESCFRLFEEGPGAAGGLGEPLGGVQRRDRLPQLRAGQRAGRPPKQPLVRGVGSDELPVTRSGVGDGGLSGTAAPRRQAPVTCVGAKHCGRCRPEWRNWPGRTLGLAVGITVRPLPVTRFSAIVNGLLVGAFAVAIVVGVVFRRSHPRGTADRGYQSAAPDRL